MSQGIRVSLIGASEHSEPSRFGIFLGTFAGKGRATYNILKPLSASTLSVLLYVSIASEEGFAGHHHMELQHFALD